MKIAALILVHRYPEQACLLVDTLLEHPSFEVFIHVDAKSPDVHKTLKKTYTSSPRVHMIEKRFKVYWGSYGQIKATIALMQAASAIQPDYAFLISGQDFPTQPLTAFEAFLKANEGTEFMSYFPLPDPQWADGGLSRLQYFHFNSQHFPRIVRRLNGVVQRIQKVTGYKRAVKGKYFGGSNWFNITGKSLTEVCNQLKQNPALLRPYRYTLCADELFTQSLLLNLLNAPKAIANDLRMIDWGSGPEYPRIWRKTDFERLIQEKERFFARKFDQQVDKDILLLLKEHVSS
jgi:hypothetical protein